MNSSELRGYLTGLIIGDGCIDKGVTKRAFELKSINQEFIYKVFEDISSCSNFKITVKHHRQEVTNGVNHKEHWVLRISAHPYFVKKYHHFYDDMRKRTMSAEATRWLTEAGLANWYMSDGYVCLVGKENGRIYNRRVELCTDRYPKIIVERMASMLTNRFGLDTSIIKRKSRYRIRIKVTSYEHFIMMIYPYIVPSMRYKLYLGYEKQPKWMSDELWLIQNNLSSAITLASNVAG